MTFLDIIAKDLLEKHHGDLHELTVVFPNKRASLFLNQSLAEQSEAPVWCPRYTTISDLFRSQTTLEIGDRIQLVIELYRVYSEVTRSTETLDQFWGWGELLLADFDDIDKHMADASKVFTLVGDLHELDNTDYLNDEQREILRQFFSNFTDDHSSTLRHRFLQLWSRLGEIYQRFRSLLLSKGIAYEGLLYRTVIESLEQTNFTEQYVFIGFNLLNDVEQRLFMHLFREQRARFYWDYDAYYMKQGHEAGRYINEHLRTFPNELSQDNAIYHQFGCQKDFSLQLISSPTDDLQARYITQWLTPERISAGRRTAIVLADETLLETVLHCLPPAVRHVNITTGYPLAKHPVASMVRMLITLYTKPSMTLHNINAVLRHPYAKHISPLSPELHARLNADVIYYPTASELALDDNLQMLFSPCNASPSENKAAAICDRLIWVVKTVAMGIRENGDDFHGEGLFRMYGVLNRLRSTLFADDAKTLYDDLTLFGRLLIQVIQQTSIPFHGEPVEGIQIMGVLETRNLDFDHLLLLSANEGKLPAKVDDSSFIPHNVRKAYNLTTVENKVAIYSYYFHRLLSRVSDADVVYNNSTEDGKTGEVSRFMLQLLAESGLIIGNRALEGGQATTGNHPTAVTKTAEMVEKLLERKFFSPSGLSKYLRCQLSFYHAYVDGLRENDDSDEEEMDSRMFGVIFHRAAELLYKPHQGRQITQSLIEGWLKEKGHITLQRIVDEAFREVLFKITDNERKMPRLGGLQVVNREMVLLFLQTLLRYDLKHTPFTIIATEQEVMGEIAIQTNDTTATVPVGGTIDRMDCVMFPDGTQRVRVIDYKTGTPPKGSIAMGDIAEIFKPENIKQHSDYYLQAMLYSSILIEQGEKREIAPGVLYVQHADADGYSPHLLINKVPRGYKGDPLLNAAGHIDEFNDGLRSLLEEITDTSVPFTPTDDMTRCENCAYHNLCWQ